MNVHLGKRLCLAITLVLLLAGCGATSLSASGPASGAPTATASVPPPSGTPNSTAGTITGGPISVATDHAAYAPSDSIHVTLTNHSTGAIGAYNHQASCSIFALETQVNGTWQSVDTVQSSLAVCSQGQPTRLLTVNAGAVYQADIQAGAVVKTGTVFPPGQYRIRLTYTTTPTASQDNQPVGSDGNPAFTSLYSAALTVATDIKPQPTATVNSAGATTSGTVMPVGTTQP